MPLILHILKLAAFALGGAALVVALAIGLVILFVKATVESGFK